MIIVNGNVTIKKLLEKHVLHYYSEYTRDQDDVIPKRPFKLKDRLRSKQQLCASAAVHGVADSILLLRFCSVVIQYKLCGLMDGHNEWLTDLFGCCADESYHTGMNVMGCLQALGIIGQLLCDLQRVPYTVASPCFSRGHSPAPVVCLEELNPY